MRSELTRGARLVAVPLMAIAMALVAAACGGGDTSANGGIARNADQIRDCGMTDDPACDRIKGLLRDGWGGSIVVGLQGKDDAVALGEQDTYSCDPFFFLGASAPDVVLVKILDGDTYDKDRRLQPKEPEILASDLPSGWKAPNLSRKDFVRLVKAGLAETDKDGNPTKLAVALAEICQKKQD